MSDDGSRVETGTSETSLLAFVHDRDIPCPGCGYNLRGLRGVVCPECQQALELRVGLTEPRLGLWLAATIGCAIGFGFNAMFLATFAAMWLARKSGGGDREIFGFMTVGSVVFGLILIAMIRMRPRLRRLPTPVRLGIVIGIVVLLGLDLTWLVTIA